jgi:hypothetical protein
MDVIAVLIVFAGIAALICARVRAAGPALLFGALAIVLFCFTPAGAGLPGALASAVQWIGTHGGGLIAGGAS